MGPDRHSNTLPVLVLLLLLGAAMLPAVGGDTRQLDGFGGTWSFDEGTGSVANDDSDHGNDGTVVDATWADGVLGTGLRFDGSGYVTVPDDPTLEAGGEDFTVWLWFKTSSLASQMLVCKWDPTDHGFFLKLNSNGTVSYFISDGTNSTGASPTFTYDDGRWHLLTMVRDSSYETLTLYVDGDELDEVADTTGNLTDTAMPLTIGRPSWSTFEDLFVGSMDEVDFDDSAAYGFLIWYYYYVVSSWVDIIGFWPYDEDLGPVVEDYSPSRNNGTATGIAYVDGVDIMCGRFSGVAGQHVVVPHATTLDVEGSFSFQTWVRTSETGQAQDLIGKYSPSELNTGFYARVNPSGGSQGQVGAFVFSVNPNSAYRASSVSVADGEWHFLVGVYNVSGRLDVYVDGELANGPLSGTVPASPANNAQPLLMGKGYHGDMDEVMIYGIALTADEVMARYLSYDLARPPEIEELGEFEALEDQTSVFYLEGYISDPDTPVAWLDIWTDSDNCTVVDRNLQFLYQRGGVDETVTVYVSDDESVVSAELVVHVQEVNDPPVMAGIPTQRMMEDEEGVVDLASYISDEETEPADLTVFCEHPNMRDLQGHCLTFLFPSPVERQQVNVSVYDGTTFTYGVFSIEVTDVNDPPVIEGVGELTPPVEIVVVEGTTCWYDVLVSDEDDEDFEYEMESEWTGLTVLENGTLCVSAAKGDVGSFNGTLTVRDWNGESTSMVLTVEVSNVNDPPGVPVITSPLNDAIYTEGDLVNFTVDATDPDMPLGDTLRVVWRSSLAGKLAELTYGDPAFNTAELAPGVHQITVEVSDGTFTRQSHINITVKKAPSTASEGFFSSGVAIAGIAGLVILVLVGVVVLLMVTRKKEEARGPSPAPGPGAPMPGGPPPGGYAAQGGQMAPGQREVVVDVPAAAGPAAPATGLPGVAPGPAFPQQQGAIVLQKQEGPAGPYTPPPAPGTWKDRTFSVSDLRVAGPPVELPRGEGGGVARASGVFQANPDLTPITLKKAELETVPIADADAESRKADRETEVLAMSNTILRIPGGLTRRLMGYDMWDLAAKVVDAEKVTAHDGKPMIHIDGRYYYADASDLNTFLSEVPGEEEGAKPKGKATKKAKTEPSAAGEVDEEAQRREMLEKLDQRLIDGDISEETYERLRKKYGGG